MTTNDETTSAPEGTEPEAPKPEAPAAREPEAAAIPPKVEDPEEVRAAAREALAGLRDNPTAAEALQNLATISELVKDPTLEGDLVAAAQSVVLSTLATPQLPPGTHAHMTVLFSHLLALHGERESVDALYAAWVRHDDAFGAGHATPGGFQQEAFVQRLADLLGWGLLEGDRDRDGLGRFAAWIDSWNPRNKFRVRRVLDMLHRNFPAAGAWRTIHFPSGEGRPQGDGRDHRGPRPPQAPPKPAAAPAPEAAAAPSDEVGEAGDDEGEAQPADNAAAIGTPGAGATREGGKRRRRRGGRKNRARQGDGAQPAAAPGNTAAAPAGDEDNRGNVKPPEPSYDDDDTQPPGI